MNSYWLKLSLVSGETFIQKSKLRNQYITSCRTSPTTDYDFRFSLKRNGKIVCSKNELFFLCDNGGNGENFFRETKLCPVWRKNFLAAGPELFSAVYIP